MILIVTNSRDATIDFYSKQARLNFFRLNTDKLLTEYNFSFIDDWYINDRNNKSTINRENINGIYYRRPALPEIPLEHTADNLIEKLSDEIFEIYDSFIKTLDTKWLNQRESLFISENKLEQMKRAKECGFSVPKTILSNDLNILNREIERDIEFCIKPMSLGIFTMNEETYVPYTAIIKKSDITNLTQFPSLLQEYIYKDYELRITCVGTKVFPVKITSQNNPESAIDWRVNNCASVNYEITSIDNKFYTKIQNLLHSFNLNFACMDFIVTKENKVYFLDLNPNGQWAWLDELLKTGISKAIEEYFYE